MNRFTSWYLHKLEQRPILTKSISSMFLVGAGDAITQTFVHPQSTYDYVRTAKMASYGLIMIGPTLHLWYKVLDRYVARKYPANYVQTKREKTMNAIRQMVVDQTLFAPLALVQFLGYMGLIEGKPIQSIVDKLKVDMMPTLVANWYLWPAVQMINFALIPLQYRVLFVNSVSIVWNAYLSHVQHKD